MEKDQTNIKVVLAAGGTGGHLFPAQTLAQKLKQKDESIEIIFVGPNLGSSPYFNKDVFSYHEITSATPFKKNPIESIKALFPLTKGVIQSLKFLKKFKPKILVGFGSFHSFPILVAAKLLSIPIVLFEADALPGKVNRLFSRWARVSAIHFIKAAEYLHGKTISVAMPLKKKKEEICKKKAREYFQLDGDRLTFLIFGGSQGAQSINRFFCESLEKLLKKPLDFQVIHITGNPERAEKLKLIYDQYHIPCFVKSFEENLHLARIAADLSISRAGASSVAEMIEFGTPGIVIPYRYGGNHQEKNAEFIANEIGGAIRLREGELTSDQLVTTIEEILHSSEEKLNLMRRALSEYYQNRTKKELSEVIFDIINTSK